MVYVGKKISDTLVRVPNFCFFTLKKSQVGSEASEAYEEDFEKSSEARQILRDTAEKSHIYKRLTVANSTPSFPGSIWDLVLS